MHGMLEGVPPVIFGKVCSQSDCLEIASIRSCVWQDIEGHSVVVTLFVYLLFRKKETQMKIA